MVRMNLDCRFADFGGIGTSVDGRMDGSGSSVSVATLLLSKTEKLSSGVMEKLLSLRLRIVLSRA